MIKVKLSPLQPIEGPWRRGECEWKWPHIGSHGTRERWVTSPMLSHLYPQKALVLILMKPQGQSGHEAEKKTLMVRIKPGLSKSTAKHLAT